MKFEHKIIDLRGGKKYLSLEPREGYNPDYASIAISSDIRDKYYLFLKRPSGGENPYFFFEGNTLYIIKNKSQNEVYFIDKYSEVPIEDHFRKLFFSCLSWQTAMEVFELLTPEKILKENYRGTGKFQELCKKYQHLDYMNGSESYFYELKSTLEVFIVLVKEIIKNEFSKGKNDLELESLINKIKDLYKNCMEEAIEILVSYSPILQKENWTEWESALYDWKEFFLEKQVNEDSKAEVYLKEFLRLCNLRELSRSLQSIRESGGEDSNKIIENTINRVISSVGNRYGVKEESIIKSFQKYFHVNKKAVIISLLERKIYEE